MGEALRPVAAAGQVISLPEQQVAALHMSSPPNGSLFPVLTRDPLGTYEGSHEENVGATQEEIGDFSL